MAPPKRGSLPHSVNEQVPDRHQVPEIEQTRTIRFLIVTRSPEIARAPLTIRFLIVAKSPRSDKRRRFGP